MLSVVLRLLTGTAPRPAKGLVTAVTCSSLPEGFLWPSETTEFVPWQTEVLGSYTCRRGPNDWQVGVDGWIFWWETLRHVYSIWSSRGLLWIWTLVAQTCNLLDNINFSDTPTVSCFFPSVLMFPGLASPRNWLWEGSHPRLGCPRSRPQGKGLSAGRIIWIKDTYDFIVLLTN